MTNKGALALFGIIGMFILTGLYFFLTNYPRGSYSIEEGQVKIEVSVRENTLGFQETEFNYVISLEDGPNQFDFNFVTVGLRFSLIKRNNNGNNIWVVDDDYNGIAQISNGTIQDWTCWDCGTEHLDGNDLATFTFDHFKWSFTSVENGL